jgi:hypothetical protein
MIMRSAYSGPSGHESVVVGVECLVQCATVELLQTWVFEQFVEQPSCLKAWAQVLKHEPLRPVHPHVQVDEPHRLAGWSPPEGQRLT